MENHLVPLMKLLVNIFITLKSIKNIIIIGNKQLNLNDHLKKLRYNLKINIFI